VAKGKNRFLHPFPISSFVGVTRPARFSRKYDLWESPNKEPVWQPGIFVGRGFQPQHKPRKIFAGFSPLE
jgi:hypothetical protein